VRRARSLNSGQLRLIQLVTGGLGNKEIASVLGVSQQAVKERISGLLQRLGAPNRAALAAMGARTAVVGAVGGGADWLPFVFRTAPMAIAFLRGPDHVFEAMNDEARRAAGSREVLGRSFHAAFPEAAPEISRLLDETYARGDPRIGRVEKDSLSVFAYRVPPVEGELPGVLVFAIASVAAPGASRP